MTTLDFCPRRELVARLESGWRLLPAHTYRPDDRAILVMLPEAPEPMTAEQIRAAAARFGKAAWPAGIPNTLAASNSRDMAKAWAKRRAAMHRDMECA